MWILSLHFKPAKPSPSSVALRLRRLYKTRSLTFLAACLILTLLVSGCGGSAATTSTDLTGHITIIGSTALQPLAAAAALLFEKQHPHTRVDVHGGGSIVGLKAVTTNQADIGDSDVYADPALFPDPSLIDHIVCIIPFTLILGPQVNIASLTQQQLVDIFSTRKLQNWRQLGGPNLPITVIVRPSTSGTRAIFRKSILGGRDEYGHLLKTDSTQAVRDAVAHTPGAIGYLALPFLNSSVHAVAIAGQSASVSNIETKRYQFWGYEHMYSMGNSNSIVAAFLDFMLSAEIKSLVQHLHYIPTA